MEFFTGKLVDIAVSGVMAVAPKLVPASLRAKIRDRLDDINPWNDVKTNHDLVRAVRLAWIAATRRVLKAAREQARTDPAFPDAERKAAMAFADSARARLVPPRDLMRRRDVPVGPSPIDAKLGLVLEGTPEFVDAQAGSGPDETAIDAAFTEVLTELVGIQPDEIRPLALLVSGGSANPAQGFASLVFAEFAELIKDGRYPQATEAFRIHLWNRVMGAVGDVGAAVREAAAKLPAMEAMLAGAGASLARIEQAQERHGEALQDIRTQQAAANRRLDQILSLVLGGGKIADADRERLRQEIESAQKAGGIEDKAVEALLRKLVESATPLENLAAEMKSALSGLREVMSQVQRPHNLESRFEDMRLRAVGLLREGDLDGADGLLADLDDALTAAHRSGAGGPGRRSRAAIKADRAGVALARLRFGDAAAFYAEAAAITADITAESWRYRSDEVDALLRQAGEYDDDDALDRAVAKLDPLLALVVRQRDPVRWAETRLRSARVLLLSGRNRGDGNRLDSALKAFSDAQEAAERNSALYVSAERGGAIALRELAATTTDRARSEALLEACRQLYEQMFAQPYAGDFPLDIQDLRLDQAAALLHLGKLKGDAAILEEALSLVRDILDEYQILSMEYGRLKGYRGARRAILEAEIILSRHKELDWLRIGISHLEYAEKELPSDRMRFERKRMYWIRGEMDERMADLELDPEGRRFGFGGNEAAASHYLKTAVGSYRKFRELCDPLRNPRELERVALRAGELHLRLFERGKNLSREQALGHLAEGAKLLGLAADLIEKQKGRDSVKALRKRAALMERHYAKITQ